MSLDNLLPICLDHTMGNHFHLAVELSEPNLSEGMKWLQGTWIRRFNQYRSWSGRPFARLVA